VAGVPISATSLYAWCEDPALCAELMVAANRWVGLDLTVDVRSKTSGLAIRVAGVTPWSVAPGVARTEAEARAIRMLL